MDPTFNMMLRLLRDAGKQAIVTQMRGSELHSTMPGFRARINTSFGTQIERVFPKDRYALRPDAIQRGGYTWCLYPVPEADAFLHGLPRWCLCLAGYLRGQLHRALVFEPHTGNYYTARFGGGAYERIRRMRFADNRQLDHALLALHSPISARPAQRLVGAMGPMINSGSWLLDLLDCASGRVDVFYGTAFQPALVRIAAFFVNEIGGLAADGRGRPLSLRARSLFAANGHLFEQARPFLLNGP